MTVLFFTLLFFLLLAVGTVVAGVQFRLFLEKLRPPPPPPPPPPPKPEPPPPVPEPPIADLIAFATQEKKREHLEKLALIEDLPLPPEDKRSLINDEDERYANSMRDVLNWR